ncbi:hypothetical protein F2Q69_00028678 [Brassica cretica]|uniref:Uncharacterized protein n=1 Tax=Brassica cretica TaxID=69181 RepID=A0A8S9RW43_BRACR|nr:hypothetical protein F2Q69_00028678 [Brassica cretica]
MSRLPPSVMLFAFVLLLLELQLEPWKRPPASVDTASGRVLSTSDFGLSPADPDLLTETRSGAHPLYSSKSLRLRCSPTRPSFRHRRAALSCPHVASASRRSIYCSDYHRELRPLASVGYCFPPTSQATSIFPITVVKYFTLRSEVLSTISGDSFASGPRLFSNPVQSLVTLQLHCRRISFNATAIVTSRFYGAKLYHLNLLFLVTAGSIVQECGFARFARYIFTVASPSHYAVSSIDGSSHCRICGPPNLLVAGTIIVQECGFARFTNFITAALPSHYAVSNIDGFLLMPYLYSSSHHWRVETLARQNQDLIVCRSISDELSASSTHEFAIVSISSQTLVSVASPPHPTATPIPAASPHLTAMSGDPVISRDSFQLLSIQRFLLMPYLYSSSHHWRVETLARQNQDLIVCRSISDELSASSTHEFAIVSISSQTLVSVASPPHPTATPIPAASPHLTAMSGDPVISRDSFQLLSIQR